MKDNYLVCIILLLFLKSIGQTPNPMFSSSEKVFGKVLTNNLEIKGTNYEFNDFLQEIYADTITNLLTLKVKFAIDDRKWLTNDGYVAVFDTKTQSIAWANGVNYQFGDVKQFNSVILNLNLNNGISKILDQKNGNVLWDTKCRFNYCDPQKLIGLARCVEKKQKDPKLLHAVNLNTGAEIWSKEMNYEYGYNECLKINDSIIVMASSGIHKININNGLGWDYDLVTGEKNNIYDIISNIVRENSKLYIASKEKLVCIDENTGVVVWSVTLPKDSMSKSHLFIKDNTLYLVNRGFVTKVQGFIHKTDVRAAYGKPFIGAYRLEDGQEKFLIPMATKEVISAMEVRGDAISLILKSNIVKYSLKDGTLLGSRPFKENDLDEPFFFSGDLRLPQAQKLYYQSKDSIFHNLNLSDNTKEYVITTNFDVLILNEQLNMEGIINGEDLYLHFATVDKHKLFNNMKDNYKTLILDKEDKTCAEIEATYLAVLIGKTLYDCNKNNLTEIDLSTVIKKQ